MGQQTTEWCQNSAGTASGDREPQDHPAGGAQCYFGIVNSREFRQRIQEIVQRQQREADEAAQP
jgi:hypothetical protein